MHRFVQQARRATPLLKRGYATETKAAESVPAETFNTSAFRTTAIVAAVGFVWFNVDQSIRNAGNKNVMTKWIEGLMTPSAENDKTNEAFAVKAQKLADYRLVYQEAQRAPITRARYPESFERSSPRALSAGVNADVSNVQVRTD
ncbi:hypothetical protein BC940DRAFT_286875 [Gongronella butleri]|nr:hypothetical protein BC940DRAFT_286875 [Gongronella butleri]